MKPKALILQAHGTNRDYDVADAVALAGADPECVPLNHLRTGKKHFSDYQMLVLPGGFSYADALGAGKLLAIDLNAYFVDEIDQFVSAGKPVVGICNGFQTLVKSGVLPGDNVVARSAFSATTLAPHASASGQSPANQDSLSEGQVAALPKERVARNDISATLTFNTQGHFECRWVTMKPVSQTCIWTKDLNELIECPIAHGEGNFQLSDGSPLSTIRSNDQIALVYVSENGLAASGSYPANPNGSIFDVAGICNPQGNVLGLMPHPENHIHPYQHPNWTRGVNRHGGLSLFQNGVKYAGNL